MQSAYVPGELIEVLLHISNTSREAVSELLLRLRRTITLKAIDTVSDNVLDVSNTHVEEWIQAGQKDARIKLFLPIPTGLHPSVALRHITCSYTVICTAITKSSCATDFSAENPIRCVWSSSVLDCVRSCGCRVLPTLPVFAPDWIDQLPYKFTPKARPLCKIVIPAPLEEALPDPVAITRQPKTHVASLIHSSPFDRLPPLVMGPSTISSRYPPGYGPEPSSSSTNA